MKKYFYLTIVSIAALNSCSSEDIMLEESKKENVDTVFTAIIDSEPMTRTTLVEGSTAGKLTKVNWEATDKVNINGVLFSVEPNEDNASIATLKSEEKTSGETYKAYYPASMYDNGTVSLPASYDYNGSFNMPMYAESNNMELSFKNICGVLAITIPSTELTSVSSIVVSSDQQMNGAISNISSEGILTFGDKTLTDEDKKITLNFTSEKIITASETFYVPIPAGTHKPLKIVVSNSTDSHAMITKNSTGAIIENNKIYAITFADNNLLSGLFSVDDNKKVRFTNSDLYWDGQNFKLENTPTSGNRSGSSVSHFYWTKNVENSYKVSFDGETPYNNTDIPYFRESKGGLTVDGTSGLYVLQQVEWDYLLNKRTNANNLRKFVNGKYFVIAPDGYLKTLKDNYTESELIEEGLVCLSPCGYRSDNTYKETGLCRYWSSISIKNYASYAYSLCLDSSEKNNSESLYGIQPKEFCERYHAIKIRLVKN